MVGSYGPGEMDREFTTEVLEAPKGMMMRGDYENKAKLYDDDRNIWASWTWTTEIVKDW